MKKYINPTAKEVIINTQSLLSGSETAPGVDPTQKSETDDRAKGIFDYGFDED